MQLAPGIFEFEATCRYCRERFAYQSPGVSLPGDRRVPMGAPRWWCHAEACVAQHEAALKAERDAEYDRMREDEVRKRREAYTDPVVGVPAIYHREARIAPASLAHVVEELRAWQPSMSLYLRGPSSSGKSHQIASLLHGVAGRLSFEWYDTRRLIADTQASFGDKKRERPGILADPKRCAVLVLDDLFAERATEFAVTELGSIIHARYAAGLPVVVTTNVALSEIENRAADGRGAQAAKVELRRIAERLIEMTTPPYGLRHTLDGINWRHALADGTLGSEDR